MKVKGRSSDSWFWKGLLSIRPVLAKGIIFRVGRGCNINFWEDPWIPNCLNYKPSPNPNPTCIQEGMVDSLLSPEGSWNKELLVRLFDRDSVANILKIFWADTSADDKIVWNGTHSGRFQVKSVYKYINPINADNSTWWNYLWKSKIHDWFKFFMWKLASRGLPIRSNLRFCQRGTDESRCPHGCDSEEDEVHIFFKCNAARALWMASPWVIKWEHFQIESLEAYLNLLSSPYGSLPILPADESSFFLFSVLILDTLWKIWNNLVFEGRRPLLEEEVRTLYVRYTEHKNANVSIPTHNHISTITRAPNSPWNRPPFGSIKANCDASVKNGAAGIGVVFRDHEGRIIKIKSFRVNIGSTEAAEAIAIFTALQVAVEEGFRNIYCESDSKLLIQSLNDPLSGSTHWSTFGFISKIEDLRSSFDSISFSWIPRDTNKLAHLVSRRGLLNCQLSNSFYFLYSDQFAEVVNQDSSLPALS